MIVAGGLDSSVYNPGWLVPQAAIAKNLNPKNPSIAYKKKVCDLAIIAIFPKNPHKSLVYYDFPL